MICKLELCSKWDADEQKTHYWWRVRTKENRQILCVSETYTRRHNAVKTLIKFGNRHGYMSYVDTTQKKSKGKPDHVIVDIKPLGNRERMKIRAKQLDEAIRDLGGAVSPIERDIMHMVKLLRRN